MRFEGKLPNLMTVNFSVKASGRLVLSYLVKAYDSINSLLKSSVYHIKLHTEIFYCTADHQLVSYTLYFLVSKIKLQLHVAVTCPCKNFPRWQNIAQMGVQYPAGY